MKIFYYSGFFLGYFYLFGFNIIIFIIKLLNNNIYCNIINIKLCLFLVNLNKTIESLVAELDAIEKSLFSLKSSENIKDVQENVEVFFTQ